MQAFLPELREVQSRAKTEGGTAHGEATARVLKLVRKVLVLSCIIGFSQIFLCIIPSYYYPQARPSPRQIALRRPYEPRWNLRCCAPKTNSAPSP